MLGSPARVGVLLEESGSGQHKREEEESEHSVEEVPAVEVLEPEVEQQVGQGDLVDSDDDVQGCIVGL